MWGYTHAVTHCQHNGYVMLWLVAHTIIHVRLLQWYMHCQHTVMWGYKQWHTVMHHMQLCEAILSDTLSAYSYVTLCTVTHTHAQLCKAILQYTQWYKHSCEAIYHDIHWRNTLSYQWHMHMSTYSFVRLCTVTHCCFTVMWGYVRTYIRSYTVTHTVMWV